MDDSHCGDEGLDGQRTPATTIAPLFPVRLQMNPPSPDDQSFGSLQRGFENETGRIARGASIDSMMPGQQQEVSHYSGEQKELSPKKSYVDHRTDAIIDLTYFTKPQNHLTTGQTDFTAQQSHPGSSLNTSMLHTTTYPPADHQGQASLAVPSTSDADTSDIPFPRKLYEILENAERDGTENIVAWRSHGRAFSIHDREAFTEHIMPKFFNSTRFASFSRQLGLYNFFRIKRGRDKGAYFHELFLRGRPDLVSLVTRPRRRSNESTFDISSVPDFFLLPPCRNLYPHEIVALCGNRTVNLPFQAFGSPSPLPLNPRREPYIQDTNLSTLENPLDLQVFFSPRPLPFDGPVSMHGDFDDMTGEFMVGGTWSNQDDSDLGQGREDLQFE